MNSVNRTLYIPLYGKAKAWRYTGKGVFAAILDTGLMDMMITSTERRKLFNKNI